MSHLRNRTSLSSRYSQGRVTRKKKEDNHFIVGTICHAGTDFIEVISGNNAKTMILKDQVKRISLAECDCKEGGKGHDAKSCCRIDGCGCDTRNHCSCSEHQHCCRKEESSCFIEHDCGCHCCYHGAIPLCDGRVQLRLAGLTDNLDFRFFMLKGCKVKVELNS